MILEIKGVDNQQNKTKREFLNEWVKAVNSHGGFGKWNWDVLFHPNDIEQKLKKYFENQNRSTYAESEKHRLDE